MIELIKSDITNLPDIDVIVNAANQQLKMGGGVCGAIYNKANPILLDNYIKTHFNNLVNVGSSVMTPAFGLPNKAIIHSVGPIYEPKSNYDVDKLDYLLSDAYISAIEIAHSFKYKSIAFPCISTGIYGFPNDRAATIAYNTLEIYENQFDKIVICTFLDVDYNLYKKILNP